MITSDSARVAWLVTVSSDRSGARGESGESATRPGPISAETLTGGGQ